MAAGKKKSWLSLFIESDDTPTTTTEAKPGDLDTTEIDALLASTRALTEAAGGGQVSEPIVDRETLDAMLPPIDTLRGNGGSGLGSSKAEQARSVSGKGTSTVVEGRPFSAIYEEEACVPPAPKPVESIILFLDGLRSMPETVQRQALTAMDAADTSWTIDDVVLDAKNKRTALVRAKQGLASVMTTAASRAEGDLAAQDELIRSATQKINESIEGLRAQIRELETLRDSETSSAEDAKTSIRNNLQATQQACGREAARFDAEISRLDHFIDTFGPRAQGASA